MSTLSPTRPAEARTSLVTPVGPVIVLPAQPPAELTRAQLYATGWPWAFTERGRENADVICVDVPGFGPTQYVWSDPDGGPAGYWRR